MRLILQFPCYALLSVLLGCRPEPIHLSTPPMQPTEMQPTAATAASTATKPTGNHVDWGDKIAWRSWESAQDIAKTQGKSICLIFYADWCSHCKELAPVFSQPDVVSAAEGLSMVHQDQDAAPAWLKEKFGAYGEYTPRVLFLSPDGKVRDDLTSGHPRYPHFYAPMVKDQLVMNMRAASLR